MLRVVPPKTIIHELSIYSWVITLTGLNLLHHVDMKLLNIDKVRYRKHLNIVILSSIIALTAGSLLIARVLITFFPDPDGSHFHWNLLGVILTSLAIGMVINQVKSHDFMTEVTYVWKLKQVLNKITRKMGALEEAGKAGDAIAMQIINYSYAGSKLLWELDDNNIVMDELLTKQAKLDEISTQHGIELDVNQFDIASLENY